LLNGLRLLSFGGPGGALRRLGPVCPFCLPGLKGLREADLLLPLRCRPKDCLTICFFPLLPLLLTERSSDLLLRRPRSSGEKDLRRRLVFLSEPRDLYESLEELTDRRRLFRMALGARVTLSSSYCEVIMWSGEDGRARRGDGERDAAVDIVDTEVEECEDIERDALRGLLLESPIERLRPRSASFRASCSSAIPFLRH
jgi:hypothetical protein